MQNSWNDFVPNLFLLGAAKCGTTTLHRYLQEMPEICMSDPKEPFFFECEYELGLQHYREKYFSHFRGEQWAGDARHRNLYLPFVAERILKVNPQAKLLAVFRNPTDRAYSHWWHAHSRGFDPLPFKKAIREDLKRINSGKDLSTTAEISEYCSVADNVTFYRTYVDSGYYMKQISRYLERFPQEQLKVILTEDLERDHAGTINSIREFLNLPVLKASEVPAIKANEKKQREAGETTHKLVRSTGIHYLLPPGLKKKIYATYNRYFLKRKKMNEATRRLLTAHFKPHNMALATFLNRDLSHWNR